MWKVRKIVSLRELCQPLAFLLSSKLKKEECGELQRKEVVTENDKIFFEDRVRYGNSVLNFKLS